MVKPFQVKECRSLIVRKLHDLVCSWDCEGTSCSRQPWEYGYDSLHSKTWQEDKQQPLSPGYWLTTFFAISALPSALLSLSELPEKPTIIKHQSSSTIIKPSSPISHPSHIKHHPSYHHQRLPWTSVPHGSHGLGHRCRSYLSKRSTESLEGFLERGQELSQDVGSGGGHRAKAPG